MKIIVNESICPQNHSCPSVGVCPVNALQQIRFNAPMVLEDKCIKCGKCVSYCPMGAIQSVEE